MNPIFKGGLANIQSMGYIQILSSSSGLTNNGLAQNNFYNGLAEFIGN